MILGGSNCQIHAFERARAREIETILVDYYDNPPAAKHCGTHEQISTFDAAACLNAARKHAIDGIMTLGTDQPVLTCARIADVMGLPCALSVDQALAATNKKIMKAFFAQNHIPAVPSTVLRKDFRPTDYAKLRPPFVTKPLDLQGQRGVFKISPADLTETLFQLVCTGSNCDEILLEEYYPSDEITFNGWVQDGRLFPLAITDRISFIQGIHIGTCTSHRFPSRYVKNYYDEIVGISDKIVQALKLGSGPVYFQMLIGEKGVRVNEIACRMGGAFEDVFIPRISGFPILDAVIKSALGERPNICGLEQYDMRNCGKFVRVLLLFTDRGTIGSIQGASELFSIPSVADYAFNYREGMKISAVENAAARFGHVVLISSDAQSIEDDVDSVYRVLRVLNTDSENILLPIK